MCCCKVAGVVFFTFFFSAVANASRNDAALERDWNEIYLAKSPSVSPDGSFFVFSWCDRIWRAPVSGGMAIPLSAGNSSEKLPILSPDARKMAYVSNAAGGDMIYELSLSEDGFSLGDIRQVSFHTEGCRPYAYTADGSNILVTAYRDNSSESQTSYRNSIRPFLVPVNPPNVERLLFDAPARSPSVSPDGGKVLFVNRWSGGSRDLRKRRKGSSSSLAGEIWLYDRRSGTFTPVVTGRDGAYTPIWTPDGCGFYYTSAKGGVRNIRFRSMKNGEDRQLTAFTDDHVFSPSLSRDGRTMIFCKGFDLWRFNPTDPKSVPDRIVLRPAGVVSSLPKTVRHDYRKADNNYGDGNYAFLPKGEGVAFTAGGDVWTMELSEDDKKRKPVLVQGSSLTHERDCTFSPDGENLYYISDRGDGADIWRVRRGDTSRKWWKNTSFVKECIVGGDDVCRRKLSVSPDGRSLAWMDFSGRLTFAGTNGVVRHVADTSSVSCQSYVWSPDGRYVAAMLRDGYGNNDVWIIPTSAKDNSGSPTPPAYNVSRSYDWDGDPAWSPDGRVIAFSSKRAVNDSVAKICYVYLNSVDEAREKSGREIDKSPFTIEFDGLFERVRCTDKRGTDPVFMSDGRTLVWSWNNKVWKAKIDENRDKEVYSTAILPISCIKGDGEKKNSDIILGVLNGLPVKNGKTFGFSIFQTIDVADWQEVAFLTAWADIRDGFCDPEIHGADWPAVKNKYLHAARNAPTWNIFADIIQRMYGEIDGSHLGFWASNQTRSRWLPKTGAPNWKPFTVHLGARFDPDWKSEGWRVRDVIPGSPSDRGRDGLLPGDVVLSIDGRTLSPDMNYAKMMTTYLPRTFTLSVMRPGETNLIEREIDGITFGQARRLLRAAEVSETRRAVRKKGNYGYLAIDAMNEVLADEFTDAVFAECFGKDGVIIDVRFNTGGYTADRLIDILCGSRHCRSVYRGVGKEGYIISRFSRPVITTIPVVVLVNERSVSNSEEFSHAMKTLGRAKLVGTETTGEVIGTIERNLLDYGVMRRPHIAFFQADGTDMELRGALPDVTVDLTPADIAAGRDPQLDAAISTLEEEVRQRKKTPPPALRYMRSTR